MKIGCEDCGHEWFIAPGDPNRDCPRCYTRTLGVSGDPKGEAGSLKPSLSDLSPVALLLEGFVMRGCAGKGGAAEYGKYNWAEHSMKASTYYDAILRHLLAWWTGEDADPKSGITHLAHIRASCGILIDQEISGRITDDRPKELASAAEMLSRLTQLIKEMET